MQIIRIIIVTIMCFGITFILLRTVIVGLRTSKLPHTDSTTVSWCSENPIGFWALIALFSVFALAAIGIWIRIVLEFIRT